MFMAFGESFGLGTARYIPVAQDVARCLWPSEPSPWHRPIWSH